MPGNHTLQTNPRHREDETWNTNSHVTSNAIKVKQSALSSAARLLQNYTTVRTRHKTQVQLFYFPEPLIGLCGWRVRLYQNQSSRLYNKTCVKRPFKNRQNAGLNHKWLIMVESIAKYLGMFFKVSTCIKR